MTVKLVVSDVDGTIVRSDKSVAPSTIDAVARLKANGVPVAIVSARPSRGMLHIQEALQLTGPLAGFNGGRIIGPDRAVIEEHPVPEPAARTALALFAARGLQTWVFSGDEWYVLDENRPHVAHETHTVQFGPTVVDSFEPYLGRVLKMVAVTDDAPFLAEAEAELQRLVGETANAKRSQTYYLDLTAREANKGNAVRLLAHALDVSLEEVAVLGDMVNDVPMFAVAGFSVAMGNASDEVKSRASAATETNDADGWSHAIDTLILPRTSARRASG